MFWGGHGAIVLALSIAAGYASGTARDNPHRKAVFHSVASGTAAAPVVDDDRSDLDVIAQLATDLRPLTFAVYVGSIECLCRLRIERVWSPGSDPPLG